MAFSTFTRFLPTIISHDPGIIDDDYEIVDDFDTSSVFGVVSIAETLTITNHECSDEWATLAAWLRNDDDVHTPASILSELEHGFMDFRPAAKNHPRCRTRNEEYAAAAVLSELEHDFQHCSVDRDVANKLQLAGRGDAGHAFGDLRSAAKCRRRGRAQNKKYNGFKSVKRVSMRQPYFDSEQSRPTLPECPILLTDKKRRYLEAQAWPGPPKCTRRRQVKDYQPWQQSITARREARELNSDSMSVAIP